MAGVGQGVILGADSKVAGHGFIESYMGNPDLVLDFGTLPYLLGASFMRQKIAGDEMPSNQSL